MKINNKNITLLSIIACGLLILVLITSNQYGNSAYKAIDSLLIQGVDTSQIHKIKISTNKKILTIQKKDNKFVINEKYNYPVDMRKINKFLINILELRAHKLITTDANNYKDFNLTDKLATKISIFTNKANTSILIGKTAKHGNGVYVKLKNKKEVFLTKKNLSIKNDAIDYLNDNLINITTQEIQQIQIINNPSITIKNINKQLQLVNIPKNHIANKQAINDFCNALTNINFKDIIPIQDLSSHKLNFKISVKTNDYLTFEITFYTINKQQYCTLKYIGPSKKEIAEVEANSSKIIQQARNAGKITDKNQLEKNNKIATAITTVKTLNNQHSKWLYLLPKWKFNSLNKGSKDLMKIVEVKQNKIDNTNIENKD